MRTAIKIIIDMITVYTSHRGNEWVGGGCRVQEAGSSGDQTVCECFHLTSFALLMSPTGSVVSHCVAV